MMLVGFLVMAIVAHLIVAIIWHTSEGAIPRWMFRTYLSWWWPYREDDFATMIALLIDQDVECKEWKSSYSRFDNLDGEIRISHSGGNLDHGLSAITIRRPGTTSSTTARATCWSDMKIVNAISRWEKRHSKLYTSAKSVKALQARDAASLVAAQYIVERKKKLDN